MQNQILDQYGNPYRTSESRFTHVASKQRLTQDVDRPISGGFTSVESPTDNTNWRLRHFTEIELATMPIEDMTDVLTDASPDLDRALSDVRMHVNTRWSLGVAEEDAAAERILEDANQTMSDRGEPLRVKIDKMISSIFLKGAIYVENIFEGIEFLNLHVNNPLNVRFVLQDDDELGQHYVRGEEQNGQFVPLDSPFIQYIPVNSVDDRPYGRSMIGAAIFPIVSLLQMMKAARQVIETQAYPFQLATIDRKQLYDVELRGPELAAEVERIEAKIRDQFSKAQKSTQFIFGKEVEIDIIGAMARRNLDAIEMLESIYKRWIIQALKQYPVLFGLSEGNALSTNAEQQLEAWTTFTDSLQSLIEEVITTAFTQILRQQGNGATVIFELQRNTSLVQKQRAERFKIKLEAIQLMLQMRLITQQQALDLVRASEAFDKISDILPPEIDPELLALPDPASIGVDDESDNDATDPLQAVRIASGGVSNGMRRRIVARG